MSRSKHRKEDQGAKLAVPTAAHLLADLIETALWKHPARGPAPSGASGGRWS